MGEKTSSLIAAYRANYDRLKSKKSSHGKKNLWDSIMNDFLSLCSDAGIESEKTLVQIKEKWRSLFNKFKAAEDHNNKTGRDRKTFEFYDGIDEFLSGSDKVNPKFVKETKVKPNVSRNNSDSGNSDELAPGQKLTLDSYLQCNRRIKPGRKPKPIPAQGNYPGEGGGVLNKVLYGEAPPRGPTPYPFIYHFGRKGTPFI